MKQKRKFKTAVLLILWVLLIGCSFLGISPLFRQIRQNKQATDAIVRSPAAGVHLRCVHLPKGDAARALTERLSEYEEFLGLYKFPDRELISIIYFGQDFSTYIYNRGSVDGRIGFFPYTYNEGLDRLGLVKLKEGEMFAFRPYTPGEEVPVVVTENEYFQLGDKIRLELNTTNGNDRAFPYAEPLYADAVVCGIAEKDVYLPATDQTAVSDLTYFTQLDGLIQVFLPDLTAYTDAFDYQPACERGAYIRYYALFDSQLPENIEEILGEYGYFDAALSANAVGWAVEREVMDFDALHLPVAIGVVCAADGIATICIVKEIVLLYYKKKDEVYD